MNLLAIAIFGVVGVLFRYYTHSFFAKTNTPFPVSTFVVNLSGSFLVGFFYAFVTEKSLLNHYIAVAILVGFFGGFTTFSTYALQSIILFETQKNFYGLLYFILSPLMALGLAWIGLILGRLVFR